MPTPIAMDDGSSLNLATAKADALASLKQSMPGYKPMASGVPTQGTGGPMAPDPSQALLGLDTPPGPSDEALSEDQGHVVGIMPPEPSDTAVKQSTEDNGTAGWDSFKHFMRDTFKGTGAETANVLPRYAAKLGGFLTNAAGGAVFLGDELSKKMGKETHLADAVFDFKKNYIDSAVEYWTPQRAQNTGQDEGSGGAAQAIGSGLEVLPNMLMGPAGLGQLIAQMGTDSAMSEIDQGHNVKTAVANGTVDAIANYAMAKFGVVPNVSVLKRIILSIPAGDLIHVASNITKQGVLYAAGYRKEASERNPLEGLGEASVQNAIFGALGGSHKPGAAKPNDIGNPPGGPAEGGAQTNAEPPPPTPEAVDATASVAPASAPAVSVPDTPTAEPVKDLRAQFLDMNSKLTPRTGVFLSTANLEGLKATKNADALAVKSQLGSARARAATVDLPNGTLIFKTEDAAKAAQARLDGGEDPQSVIGSSTGAGSGKSPDQTAVVQGHDLNGAVATETAVHPNDVPAAVQKVEDQGKKPVVTTPEEAVARRVDEINKENDESEEPTPKEPVQQMGLYKPAIGPEVPVHIEPGAEAGKIRVRPIDHATGEASDRTIDVPTERVKASGTENSDRANPIDVKDEILPTEPANEKLSGDNANEPVALPVESGVEEVADRGVVAAEPSVPEKPKSKTALDVLPDALQTHEQQESPPSGKKFPSSLAERQDNASAFAHVLKAAAAEGKASPEAIDRANKAAKAAERLTLKSKTATDKGQGTSHTAVGAMVSEMHKAARGLLGKAREGDEVTTSPKVAEIKRRIALKKAAEGKPAEAKPKPKAKKAEGLPKSDQLRTNKLSHEFLHSDPDEHQKASDKLEAWMRELAEKHPDAFPKEQIHSYLRFLTEQRSELQEGKDTGRMSDTIENEEENFDRPDEGFSITDRPQLDETKLGGVRATESRKTLNREWAALGEKVNQAGLFSALERTRDSGNPMSSHKILDFLLKHSDTPVLRELLTQLRAHAPDAPVYNRSNIISLKDGRRMGKSAGLFTSKKDTMGIQVNFDNTGKFTQPFMLRALVHEMVHASTKFEIDQHPDGELAKKMSYALSVLKDRLASKYGQDVVDSHVAYFEDNDGTVPKPEGFMRSIYGITNEHEMMSEILTNPEFAREVANSEDFRSPKENFVGSKPMKLITRLFSAIGEMLGLKNQKLLQHIIDTTFDVMESQRARGNKLLDLSAADYHGRFSDAVRVGLRSANDEAAGLESIHRTLEETPPPVRGVDKDLRRTMGEEPTETTREFLHTFKSGTADRIRKTQIAFKTVGQIFRDHFRDFGTDGEGNALRGVQETAQTKNALIAKYREISSPAAKKWQKLSNADDLTVSQLMIDTSMYKLDPRKAFADQSLVARSGKGAEARHTEFQARYNKLSPEAREVYNETTDANRKLQKVLRKAGVDTAIEALDANLTDAQKGLLYAAKNPAVYDSLIGKGKLIDIQDNDKLKAALSDFAGYTELDGPYHHLGRKGEYVVAAEPEGTREFDDKSKAQAFADMVSKVSPDSRGKVKERGGKHVVDYKVRYVSMHETRVQAERERDRLQKAGLDVGMVTQKTLNGDNAPLSAGMKELVTEAERKIQREGKDTGTEALVASLRSAFLSMVAARSAYAGSRLARRNVGGVKASDMRRNFAEHAMSSIWHTAQMQTIFQQAEAMAKLRGMARDSQAEGVSQNQMYRRGQVVEALNKHAMHEVQSFGNKAPFNAAMAKLGFMSYLASPAHALVNLTQNFTTGIPVAGAKWGYGKAIAAFTKGMTALSGPTFRSTIRAIFSKGGSAKDIHDAIVDAVRQHPTLGKWAAGDNSHLKQLMDRGVVSHGYADELGTAAQGKNSTIEGVFEWARLTPAMADSFNRVSTALAALELTGGDIRKTSDFVEQVHADYSQQNKPLAFKKVGRLWGGNTITMFKTYVQEMAHLVFGSVSDIARGHDRAEAAKILAGVMVGNALFAGIYGSLGLEPLRLAMYAYHKIKDEEGEVWDMKTAIHKFLVDHFGKSVGDTLAHGPIAQALGVDVSRRMGLSDLFFYDPPDLLSSDKDMWKTFVFNQAGTMIQELANNTTTFMGHMQKGQMFQAVSSIIPVKQYQDAVKAYKLLNEGKTDSLGAQITQPSTGDAIKQLIGFKPLDVAEAQEKTGIKMDYAAQVKKIKDDIVRQLVSAKSGTPEKTEAWARYNDWNKANPTVAIRSQDIIKMMVAKQRTTQQVPDRNAKARAAAAF